MKGQVRLEHDFTEGHIRLVWAELHDRFGFPVPAWRKRYFEEWNKGRHDNEIGFFFTFMNKHVNPVLNQILCRHPGYPTFNYLAEYVVKKRG
jgi:hypothetical protein